MKRRPLIIVACIASVCFVGICFTLFTQSYIASHSADSGRRDIAERINMTAETEEPASVAVDLAAVPFGAVEESPEAAEEPQVLINDNKEEQGFLEEAALIEEEKARLKTDVSVISKEKELTLYLEKLAGLEDQIDFSWEALESENSKPSVQQEQAVADLAYKIWDDELNAIYKLLREKLLEEDFEILKKEERLWLKTRDETAEAAALGVSNASVQKLRYTLSLTDTTKERTYELVEMYFAEE